jgi:opacity protein-like surface antigen
MEFSVRLVVGLLVPSCLLCVTTAGAQSAARLGLQAGATIPVGSYASDKHNGYHLGLLVDVKSPAPLVGFRFEGAYHELKYSGNSTRAQIWTAAADLQLKVPTSTPIMPYVIGGVGIYSSHRNLFLSTGYSTNPGVNLGGGLRFELGGAGMFIEARYHRSTGDNGIRFVPITVGVLF